MRSRFSTRLLKWTISALDCYERKCRCKGCYYSTFFSAPEQSCNMKNIVIELIRLFGIPSKEEIAKIRQVRNRFD